MALTHKQNGCLELATFGVCSECGVKADERDGRKIGDIGWYTTARGTEMEVRLGEFLENGRVYLYCTTHAMGRAVDPEVVDWD